MDLRVVLDSPQLFCYDSAIICKGYDGDARAVIPLAESLNGESRQGDGRSRITPEPLAERSLSPAAVATMSHVGLNRILPRYRKWYISVPQERTVEVGLA